jgi:uncharacterized protein (TIRG00374 family)
MNFDKSHRRRTVLLIIIALVLLAVLLIVLDWKQVGQLVGKASWEFFILAQVLTAVSYICVSYGYVLVNHAFEVQISWRELLEVGLVSTTLNNILAFMGAAGHSLRLAMIQRPGVAAGKILAASIFHSYINNVMMLLLLAVGLGNLLATHVVSGAGAVGLGLSTGFIALGVVIATVIVLNGSIRVQTLRLLNFIVHLIIRRDITNLTTDFSNSLSTGELVFRKHGWELALVLLLMLLDWVLAAFALWFCFYALGQAPGLPALLSGFGIGISAGNLSLVPGGLGVQEASMAGIYALLGISFSEAVLAAILFRVVYDFIPFFLTLILYRGLFRIKR